MPALDDHIYNRDFNLYRNCLVEAGAGTGKTYSIQTIYLRLVVEQGLPVRAILVVSFTEAAVKELRERLRGVLQEALARLEAAGSPVTPGQDDRIAAILALPVRNLPGGQTANPERRARLYRALLEFDEAAIHTIHGFCQKTLQRFAFECGQSFDSELTADARVAVDELCADWWRRNMYPGYAALRAAIAVQGRPTLDLKDLQDTTARRLARPDAILLPTPQPQPPSDKPVKDAVSALAGFWRKHAGEFRDCLASARGEGFLNARHAATIPAQLDRLADRVPPDHAVFLALLNELLAFPNRRIAVNYSIPNEVMEFMAACEAAAQPIRARQIGVKGGQWLIHAGLTAGEWQARMERVTRIWRQHRANVMQFAANDLDKLKTDLNAPDRITAALGAFDALPRVSAALKTAISRFAQSRFTPRNNRQWQKPEIVIRLEQRMQEVNDLAAVYNAGLLAHATEEIRAAYARRRHEQRTLSYDDLLINLRSALQTSGAGLGGILRTEYQAALIDEFQDTDPVQYDIFRMIFLDSPRTMPVFLVGDPKQAIYSFRSGDIYTYYTAAARIDPENVYALEINYRAETRLIDAVNQVFRDPAPDGSAPHTFLNAAIRYPHNLTARGKSADESLLTGGRPDPAPFKIRVYPRANARTPGLGSECARRIFADTAGEIVQILNDPRQTIGRRRVVPADIAVLVATHAEAALIAGELARRKVPTVRQSTGKVFAAAEAGDLALVLAAIADPRNLQRVRNARACGLFDDAAIAATAVGPAAGPARDTSPDIDMEMESYSALFQEIHDTWQRCSFITAVNRLINDAGMRARLVSGPDGERRLTNLLQLVDLTHRAVMDNRLSMENTLTWFIRQLDPETRIDRDEYEMRLETDEDAVKIMTIFHSKGLQFPIVFIPTIWRRTPRRVTNGRGTEYHAGASGDNRLVIDLQGQNEEQSRLEQREEIVRLFYVAATRAIHRTCVHWTGARAAPLAHILGSNPAPDAPGGLGDMLAARLMPGEIPAVEISAAPDTPRPPAVYTPAAARETAACRTESERSGREPWVDKTRGQASFTSLAPEHGATADGADGEYDYDAADGARPLPTDAPPEITILDFPAGARTGECWHRILETLDFQAPPADIRRTVEEQLALFQLDGGPDDDTRMHKRRIVTRMIDRLLQTVLNDDAGRPLFRLADIAPAQRRAEMDFHFALPEWTAGVPRRTAAISAVIARHWAEPHLPQNAFVERLAAWDREIPRGCMTGFIDLVVEHDDRYYIFDWKSNRRNGQIADFHPEGLHAEMAARAYCLQYLFYVTALHNYLRGCRPDYDYNRHFGGVFYVFLRGLDAPGNGIYHDRPDKAMIAELSEVLGDFT